MKKITGLLFFLMTLVSYGQQKHYAVSAANGNGFCFWNGNDSYKIDMGNTPENLYGQVTDFNIKMNMSGGVPNRGCTCGIEGQTPTVALNTLGDFHVASDFTLADGNVIGITNPVHKLVTTTGVQFRKTALGVTSASAESSWIQDEWLIGAYGPAKWNQTLQPRARPVGTYNDIGGIVFQDEGTYFLRDKAGSQLEYTNSEFLNKAFLFFSLSTSNIGIDANTPDSKLLVNGNIHAKEEKVDLVGWPEYVFHEDYNLPPLNEVQKHIEEKGYLPEMPSVKEVKENG